MKIKDFYYVTVATQKDFIKNYTQYAIKSLIKSGVAVKQIHAVVGNKGEKSLLNDLIREPKLDIQIVEEDLSHVTWRKYGGKRKYSLFKAAALYKAFGNPVKNQCMIYFDGDVLWYKNPNSFFKKCCSKTWFHHGKDCGKRASITRDKVNIKNEDILSKWCSLPMAHLIVKYGGTKIPEREVVAGLYLMHPRDHEKVLKMTYEGCLENANKFDKHEGCGDQKPMNAALTVLNIDWHGGSRFFCPEHEEYFDHFFGKKNRKSIFIGKVDKLKI